MKKILTSIYIASLLTLLPQVLNAQDNSWKQEGGPFIEDKERWHNLQEREKEARENINNQREERKYIKEERKRNLEIKKDHDIAY